MAFFHALKKVEMYTKSKSIKNEMHHNVSLMNINMFI